MKDEFFGPTQFSILIQWQSKCCWSSWPIPPLFPYTGSFYILWKLVLVLNIAEILLTGCLAIINQSIVIQISPSQWTMKCQNTCEKLTCILHECVENYGGSMMYCLNTVHSMIGATKTSYYSEQSNSHVMTFTTSVLGEK